MPMHSRCQCDLCIKLIFNVSVELRAQLRLACASGVRREASPEGLPGARLGCWPGCRLAFLRKRGRPAAAADRGGRRRPRCGRTRLRRGPAAVAAARSPTGRRATRCRVATARRLALLGRALWSARQTARTRCGNVVCAIYTKTQLFAKTGSGQTSEKLKKSDVSAGGDACCVLRACRDR